MDARKRLQHALAALADAHAQDPRSRQVAGEPQPVEQVWCDTVSRWVRQLEPQASAALTLAAAAQHLERWQRPRTDWPEGRAGYLRWRKEQQQAHAERAAALLGAADIESAVITRVQELLRKQQLARDPEVQTLEDGACLAFLELDLDDFVLRHGREDVVRILRRTWGKMSPRARALALQLEMNGTARERVEAALSETAGE